MKQFKAFIKKEFRHIFRDQRTLMIVFAMPVVLVLLFGFAITTDIKDARIAVLDNAKDEMSIALVNKLTSSGYFKTHKILNQNSQLETVFADGKIKLSIVIPPQFSKDFHQKGRADIQLIADATDPNAASTIINYASSIIIDYRDDVNNARSGDSLFGITTKLFYNPELKSVYMYVPGVLALILAIISAMMTAISITKEKEFGSFKTLNVSPLKINTIIFGKVIPYLIISLLNTFVILILAKVIFGMPVNGSVWLLLTVCIAFLFTSMSLGVMIAAYVETQQVAAILSIVGLFLPTTLLSGFIYPIENMPVILQYICQIFPAKWFIEALKNVMIKGTGIQHVWMQLLIMVSMAALFTAVSIKKFSKREA